MTVRGYVRSSPRFFRLIKIAMALAAAGILVLAALIPAPLQEQADMAKVPNPVKSAWFLLWIQELVGYSKYLIYAVMLAGLLMALLPWLPGTGKAADAAWLARRNAGIGIPVLLLFVAILVLTATAFFFRGENWSFVLPRF